MKHFAKILYSSFTAGMLLVAGLGFIQFSPTSVYAQCTPGETSGNLYGYAETEAIGPIYMSTESWNDDPLEIGHGTTTQEFSVSYNRQTERWDGRGWSPYIGWVDFGQTNSANIIAQTAEFESVLNNPDAWGNWDPTIDLSPVTYTTDPGGFVGLATNGDYTIGGAGETDDDLVGAGWIDFSNVSIETTAGDCDETVNLILDGVNILYQESCPIGAPEIQWTSVDVSDCETDVGLWASPGSRPTQNTSGETAGGSITESNTPVVFKLKCIGDGSGSEVYGTAIASCGSDCTNDDCVDPTSGVVIPEFKEV
ncbi:hypothetical protein KC901_02340 [Patescibacteria group bacterium]|nr:hypothetical protein [Patescibacteria group bacterium]